MVRIRLRRIGLKGQPTYRIVAADKESPRDGRFLEILGVYNPRTQPATVHLKEERVYHWMKNGALPTESVAQVFKSVGVLDRWERFKKGEPAEPHRPLATLRTHSSFPAPAISLARNSASAVCQGPSAAAPCRTRASCSSVRPRAPA